jgi:hypothetical protein
VGNRPKTRTRRTDFQGQDELTRPSWNVQFDKERDRQVDEFSKKLTQYQPITNVVGAYVMS